LWVCDEVGPAVRKHSIENGSVRQSIAIPPVFARMRHNLSLEALALARPAEPITIVGSPVDLTKVYGLMFSLADPKSSLRVAFYDRFEYVRNAAMAPFDTSQPVVVLRERKHGKKLICRVLEPMS
jgi:hypothetical protein